MEAPDKLYVVPMKTKSQDAFVGLAYELDKLLVRKTEYIRKDALMELVRKEMKEWSSESNTAQGVKMGLTLVLDKIESL